MKIEAIEFDKQGTNWNESMMPKDIFTRTYDIGDFLLNHSHPLFAHIKPIVFGKYKVVMKFSDGGYNNGSIWCNGRWLCMRAKKFSPVRFNKNVKLIEGTPTKSGGSNGNPCPSFEEGYCVLEFISNGLPMTQWLSGWKAELISLESFASTTPQQESKGVDEVERLRKENIELKGLEDSFSLKTVLSMMAKATDYLLKVKDYDGPDYEELEICVKRAKEIILINNL